MPYFSPGKKPPRESFPLTSHRLGKKREFEMSWAPGVAPISPPHCHSRLSRGQRRSTTYARHERSKQNSLPRSNLERKQGRMFCIFEQALVSAGARVIKAEENREEGSLMKKSYGRSRIVLQRDARPISIPCFHGPSHFGNALPAISDGGCYVYSYLPPSLANPLRRQTLAWASYRVRLCSIAYCLAGYHPRIKLNC